MSPLREKLQRRWRAFRDLPSGERFERFYEQQKDAPAWVKPVLIVAALASLAVGVVLVFIPGPAFVFFGVAGAMLATQSVHVARVLDHAEVGTRTLVSRARQAWARIRHRDAAASPRTAGTSAVKTLPPPRRVRDATAG